MMAPLATTPLWILLLCVLACASRASAAHGWRSPSGGTACFVASLPRRCAPRSSVASPSSGGGVDDNMTMPRPDGKCPRREVAIRNSADENDIEPTEDPDGIPLFDTYERATLFGLEPNEELGDPLDNGLQFTGPIILMASIYVTLSLFFADDMPPLDL